MSENTERRLLALLAETSVHAGMGSQLGAVDLPVQRERHTDWPTLYGSGLKGVLRDHAERAGWPPEDLRAVFGPEVSKDGQKEQDRHAGALALSDARLLLFPVRTAARAFAWITCPLALARLARDVEQAGLPALKPVKETPDKDKAVVTPRWPKASDGVLLEEFAYEAIASATLGEASGWIADHLLPVGAAYDYWRDAVRAGVVLVADEEFRDFVRHGTEVVTRVRLAKNKTVEQGALWTEENVPADTLFYAFAAAWKPAEGVSATLKAATEVAKRIGSLFDASRVVQVGGKETVGRGFVAVRVAGGNHGQA